MLILSLINTIQKEPGNRTTLIYAAQAATQAQKIKIQTEDSNLNLKVIFNFLLKIKYLVVLYTSFCVFLYQTMKEKDVFLQNKLFNPESKEPETQAAVLSNPDTALRLILMRSNRLRNEGRSQGEVTEDPTPNLRV